MCVYVYGRETGAPYTHTLTRSAYMYIHEYKHRWCSSLLGYGIGVHAPGLKNIKV
jgi:hypothetical protein